MGLPLKILLLVVLVRKPTGKLLPSFPHNFHLCPYLVGNKDSIKANNSGPYDPSGLQSSQNQAVIV